MKLFATFLAGLLLSALVMAQQPGPPPGGPPQPGVRLKQLSARLEKDLALQPTQTKQVEQAYKSFFADMEKLLGRQEGPPAPPPPEKKSAVDKLVKARDEKIKKALNANQYKEYLEIEQRMRPRGPGGPPGDRPAPPPPRP